MILKSRKIKLYLTNEQKQIFNKWFNDARYTYNLGLKNIKVNGLRSWMSIRNDVVTLNRYYCKLCDKFIGKVSLCKICNNKPIIKKNIELDDLSLTPKHIRLNSIKTLVTAYKSAITNLKRNNIKKFNISYKSKKRITTESIELEASSCKIQNNSIKIYSNNINFVKNNKKIKKKTKKSIPTKIKHNPKICYNKIYNEYYLIIPIEEEIKPYKFKKNNILSLDPGVKTLLSGYDSLTGDSIQFNNRIELLKKLKKKIAEIQSKNKQYKKYYKKFNNIIKDNHIRISNYIVSNYDVILLPKFESQKLKLKNRHYNNKLLNMNKHYQLKNILQWISLKRSKKTLIVDESYTSKTCGLCGTINNNLTLNDRLYNCIKENCKYKEVDRDYNGARNILIKTIVNGLRSCPKEINVY